MIWCPPKKSFKFLKILVSIPQSSAIRGKIFWVCLYISRKLLNTLLNKIRCKIEFKKNKLFVIFLFMNSFKSLSYTISLSWTTDIRLSTKKNLLPDTFCLQFDPQDWAFISNQLSNWLMLPRLAALPLIFCMANPINMHEFKIFTHHSAAHHSMFCSLLLACLAIASVSLFGSLIQNLNK